MKHLIMRAAQIVQEFDGGLHTAQALSFFIAFFVDRDGLEIFAGAVEPVTLPKQFAEFRGLLALGADLVARRIVGTALNKQQET